MSKTPLFSVIVPAFNSETFIEDCINSVLSQTETNFELLAVDDGSTDGTLPLLQNLSKKDARIKVFHQENLGHTGARNTGLSHASGEYIVFLDSDDLLEADVLLQCKNTFEKNASDLVIYGIRQLTPSGEKQFGNLVEDGHYTLQKSDDPIVSRLLMSPNGKFTFPKSLSGKAFKKDLITKSQLNIPSHILMGEDGLAFVHTMLLAKKVSVISQVNYLYVVRNDSISYRKDQHALQRFSSLLQYYWETIVPLNPCIREQFDRFVVAQLDTATRFMFRSGCDRKQFQTQWREITASPYIKAAIKHATFDKTDKNGRKMRLKHFLLRHQLFWLSRLLLK